MDSDLVADSGSNQVTATRIEALLDEKVDPSQVDDAEIDGHLLGFAHAGLGFSDLARARLYSTWIPFGWCHPLHTGGGVNF